MLAPNPSGESEWREPKRSDLKGPSMTVCIAARCTEDDSFVTISDRMLSNSWSSVENAALKKLDITPRWHVLYSGSPTEVMPILRRGRAAIGLAPSSITKATDAMENAYQKHRESLVNSKILSKFGLTLRKFLRDGPKLFTSQEHSQILSKIDALQVGLDFLVYGYDNRNVAHLFYVKDPGKAESLDIEGYGVIGSGWVLAEASLTSRPLPIDFKVNMIYRLCEAKFTAEGARSVGRETVLSFWDSPTTHPLGETRERFLQRINIEVIRKAWEKDRDRKLPAKALLTLKQSLSGSLSDEQINEMGKRYRAQLKRQNQAR